MPWLLCDYGQVLCLPQPADSIRAMAELCHLARTELEHAYWVHREAYDLGRLDAEAYWTETLGHSPGDRLAALVEIDVAGWLHPNPASVAGAERAAGRGLQLAVLSNAPGDVARAVDALPWLAPFSPRIFSCDLGVVKPDPAAYEAALVRLGAEPAEVTFFDDRQVNVEAAREAGMRAEVFTDPAQFDGVG